MPTVKIENTLVFGFAPALRAMRNPMSSWNKADSYTTSDIANLIGYEDNIEHFYLGEADKRLSQKLSIAGSEHRKHLQQIQVWCNLTIPRLIWTEFDTYKFVSKISTSTMHTLMKQEIVSEMFDENRCWKQLLDLLNEFRNQWDEWGNNQTIRNELLLEAKRYLPESFLQMRSINTNYECLLNMYHQRKNHRLPHWKIICGWIERLPYFTALTGVE